MVSLPASEIRGICDKKSFLSTTTLSTNMSFAVDGIIDLYSLRPGDSTAVVVGRFVFTFPFFCAVADKVVDNAMAMVNILRFIFFTFEITKIKKKDERKKLFSIFN